MLKAYEYTDRKKNLKEQELDLSKQEKKIALQYVIDHPSKIKSCICPICGTERSKYIFERWDVEYRYCKECGSIFTFVDADTENGYINLKELREFRTSDVYQNQEERLRSLTWDEMVDWLSFRTYRYLGHNKGLNIIDIGNKYSGLSRRFSESELCAGYDLRESIFTDSHVDIGKADIILYLNQLKHEISPKERLCKIRDCMVDDGLLVLSSRLGSGFDVLTLKGGTESIFPYEHVTLPSRKGLEILLKECGYELLEITTPGTQDVDAVFNNRERVDSDNYFVKMLLESADERTKADFQQFLQKSCLSSFAQVIARKV